MSEKKVFLGNYMAETGQIMFIDPALAIEWKESHYDRMLELDPQHTDSKQISYKNGSPFAVVAQNTIGDGAFPVFAVYDDGLLMRFEVHVNQEEACELPSQELTLNMMPTAHGFKPRKVATHIQAEEEMQKRVGFAKGLLNAAKTAS